MAEHQNPRNWPAFVTSDLGDSAADAAEMERRWTVYRDEMAALIAAGGVHQDKDGWWVDDASGELIGPDPEMEKPWTEDMFAHARPFTEAFPPWPKRSGARAAPRRPPQSDDHHPAFARCGGLFQADRRRLAGPRRSGPERLDGHALNLPATLKERLAPQ
jgi:hypothetical protein